MAEIAKAQPPEIFLFSDGPNRNKSDDSYLVEETRRVMERAITWDARVHKRFNSENEGLFRGVTGAIDWFFSIVEEGIIMEDDCVVHEDFFGYCDELLERYRSDERVWCISGDNATNLPVSDGASYGFMRDPLVGAWATWRRCWVQFDRNFELWPRVRGTTREKELYPDRVERRVRRKVNDRYAKGIDAWAFKWKMTLHFYGGLSTVPAVNLNRNIGWNRPDATHTKGDSLRANRPTYPILPLSHPAEVKVDPLTDKEWVESRGLGVKKHRTSYRARKAVGKLRRTIGRLLGR